MIIYSRQMPWTLNYILNPKHKNPKPYSITALPPNWACSAIVSWCLVSNAGPGLPREYCGGKEGARVEGLGNQGLGLRLRVYGVRVSGTNNKGSGFRVGTTICIRSTK